MAGGTQERHMHAMCRWSVLESVAARALGDGVAAGSGHALDTLGQRCVTIQRRRATITG